MTRKTGQVVALSSLTILIIVAVWYQIRQDGRLQTSVLNQYGYYGFGSGAGTTGSGTGSISKKPEDFQPNKPQSSRQEGNILELKYLVPYDELTVLDALQVPLHVPSFSTPVQWIPDAGNAENIVVDDDESTRTVFIAPKKETDLVFHLEVETPSGQKQRVAKYVFQVVSPIAYQADVNKDGKYDFQNDLVHLLRNWESYGEDSTRTLAIILSRLEEEEN